MLYCNKDISQASLNTLLKKSCGRLHIVQWKISMKRPTGMIIDIENLSGKAVDDVLIQFQLWEDPTFIQNFCLCWKRDIKDIRTADDIVD